MATVYRPGGQKFKDSTGLTFSQESPLLSAEDKQH